MVSQAAAAGDASAALPAEAMRCAGPVAVAGVREGILWLLDARGQASTSYSGCKTWKYATSSSTHVQCCLRCNAAVVPGLCILITLFLWLLDARGQACIRHQCHIT